MFSLTSLPSVFRFVMLTMLMAGMLMRPLLALECGMRDAQQPVAGDLRAANSEAPSCMEDCCSLPDCDDCCAHAIALLPALRVAPVVPVTAGVLPALAVDFEPFALPVVLRPPIVA